MQDKSFNAPVVIKPPRGFSFGFLEIWRYRELFYYFIWRDIKVKYRQTTLGLAWVILQPLALMALFSFIFSSTLRITGDTAIPYPVFVLSGLVAWNLFNSSVAQSGESMIRYAEVIRKIYFPRLIIPASTLLFNFVEFLVTLLIFFIISILYGAAPNWTAIFYFPAGIIVILLTAFGMGSFLAALNVKYRDFRYVLPFLLQIGFFATQVIYSFHTLSHEWLRYLLALNPMNAAIELFRAPLSGNNPDAMLLTTGIITAFLIALGGVYYFRKTETFFADIA